MSDIVERRMRALSAVIRRATARELKKMEEANGYIHDGWKGDALATHITAGIIRSVFRHLALPKPKRKPKP